MLNRLLRTVLAFAALTLIGASTAFAQATNTWVSGVGDDVNPCSRTAPCKTFPGAISKTAAGGQINALDSGGFGAVTITKSITIAGIGQGAGILVSGQNAITINAGVLDVVKLRHLQINGVSNSPIGIRFLAGAALIVDHVLIHGFVSGIETSAGSTLVHRSLIAQNSSYGINILGGTVSVENSTLTRNGLAAKADGSGMLRLSKTDLYDNLGALGCGTGTLASAGNNHKGANSGGSVPICLPTAPVTVF
jgi:hypothetical protein